MTAFKYYLLALTAFTAPIFCQAPYAACTITYKEIINSTSTYTPTFSPQLPIGSVVARYGLEVTPADGVHPTVNCPSPFRISHSSPLPYLGNNLYQSPVPGIALRLKSYSAPSYYPWTSGLYNPGDIIYLSSFYIDAVKTGPITHGGMLIAPGTIIAEGTIDGQDNSLIFRLRWNAGFSVGMGTQPTCTVAAPNTSVPVNFNEVSLANFNSEGRSPTVNFDIKVNCSGANNGGTRNIFITLTDQTRPGNRSTQLSLAPGSTASGVVVEVHNKNGLVSFGPDSAVIGNPGQWFETSGQNGVYSIPLSANYLKVNSNPTQGSANANATFTMSYQ